VPPNAHRQRCLKRSEECHIPDRKDRNTPTQPPERQPTTQSVEPAAIGATPRPRPLDQMQSAGCGTIHARKGLSST